MLKGRDSFREAGPNFPSSILTPQITRDVGSAWMPPSLGPTASPGKIAFSRLRMSTKLPLPSHHAASQPPTAASQGSPTNLPGPAGGSSCWAGGRRVPSWAAGQQSTSSTPLLSASWCPPGFFPRHLQLPAPFPPARADERAVVQNLLGRKTGSGSRRASLQQRYPGTCGGPLPPAAAQESGGGAAPARTAGGGEGRALQGPLATRAYFQITHHTCILHFTYLTFSQLLKMSTINPILQMSK